MLLGEAYGEVETLSLLIDLRDHLASQTDVDSLSKLGQGDSVAGQQLAAGGDGELRTLNLLLYVEVGNALYLLAGPFHLVGQLVHTIQVIAKELDGNVGPGTAQHGVDTVADGLAYLDVGAVQGGELLAHLGLNLLARTAIQGEGGFNLADVDA